jgi:hypothetical protein
VRSGQKYLLVTETTISDDIARALNLQIQECRNTNLGVYLIDIPRRIGDEYLQALAALKLGYALQAHIEPVGLVPRWDEVLGESVWLPTEELLLRLWADFDVKEFTIRLDGGDRTLIPIQPGNEPVISLGALPLGGTSLKSEQRQPRATALPRLLGLSNRSSSS